MYGQAELVERGFLARNAGQEPSRTAVMDVRGMMMMMMMDMMDMIYPSTSTLEFGHDSRSM